MTIQTQPQYLTKSLEPAGTQPNRTIYYWAATGLFFVALNVWIFGNMFAAGDMHRIDPGSTPAPQWMKTGLFISDILWGIIILTAIYFWIYQPWKKTGSLSFAGMLCLAMGLCVWQDPLFAWLTPGFSYNTIPFNIGGWACHIPGWQSPGGCKMAPGILWDFGFYFVLFPAALLFAAHAMRRYSSSHPGTRTSTLFLMFALFVALATPVLFLACISLGYWQYGGANPYFSILDGSRFKFPLSDSVFIPLLMVFWLVPIYFRNDKGEMLAERGLHQVQAGSGVKTLMRLLAHIGACNVGLLLGYSLPCILIQTHNSEWPQVIQEKSYFTNGICGQGTTYICGGMNVPISRAGQAIHISQEGVLVIPDGAPIPKLVPLRTDKSSGNFGTLN